MIKPIDTRFNAFIPNGMFSRTHELRMAIVFYMWCVARTTKEIVYENDKTRYGSVLGGMPLVAAVIGQDFPDISEWTIKHWRKTCVKAGILRAKRTPVGHIIEVVNSVKFPDNEPEKRKQWAKAKSDMGKTPHHSDNRSGSPKSDIAPTNIRCGEKQHHSPSDVAKNNIHIEVKGFEEIKENEKKPILSCPSTSKPKAAAKTIEERVRAMDAAGHDNDTIAARVGLSVPEVVKILNAPVCAAAGN